MTYSFCSVSLFVTAVSTVLEINNTLPKMCKGFKPFLSMNNLQIVECLTIFSTNVDSNLHQIDRNRSYSIEQLSELGIKQDLMKTLKNPETQLIPLVCVSSLNYELIVEFCLFKMNREWQFVYLCKDSNKSQHQFLLTPGELRNMICSLSHGYFTSCLGQEPFCYLKHTGRNHRELLMELFCMVRDIYVREKNLYRVCDALKTVFIKIRHFEEYSTEVKLFDTLRSTYSNSHLSNEFLQCILTGGLLQSVVEEDNAEFIKHYDKMMGNYKISDEKSLFKNIFN